MDISVFADNFKLDFRRYAGKEKIMEEKIRIIAEKYGYEPQSRQCIEEMAELI